MPPNVIELGSAATLIMGTSPKGETYNSIGEGLPLLNGPTEFGPSHPECTVFTTDSKRQCEPGDLIFCVRGSTTGRMNWADRVYSLGRGVCAIRGASQLETRFIKYALDLRLEALLKLSGGATFPNLTGGDIAEFPIPFPENRFAVARVLSAYDDLIENNTRRIKIFEEMAQMLYREWFVNFRFPGHEKVLMVESELGPIPEDWSVKALGDTAEITMGLSPKGDTYNEEGEGTPLVNGPVEFGERFTRTVKWTTAPSKVCGDGDLIVCVRGSTTGKFVKSNGTYCLGRGVCAMRSQYQCFVDLLFRDELPKLLAQTSGSTFPSWTAPQLKSHPVICPSRDCLERFEAVVRPITTAVLNHSRRIENLRTTRDLLLPKLISGEVPVESADDAAAELMEQTA